MALVAINQGAAALAAVAHLAILDADPPVAGDPWRSLGRPSASSTMTSWSQT
jgi:hypothetical protein